MGEVSPASLCSAGLWGWLVACFPPCSFGCCGVGSFGCCGVGYGFMWWELAGVGWFSWVGGRCSDPLRGPGHRFAASLAFSRVLWWDSTDVGFIPRAHGPAVAFWVPWPRLRVGCRSSDTLGGPSFRCVGAGCVVVDLVGEPVSSSDGWWELTDVGWFPLGCWPSFCCVGLFAVWARAVWRWWELTDVG